MQSQQWILGFDRGKLQQMTAGGNSSTQTVREWLFHWMTSGLCIENMFFLAGCHDLF